MNLQEAIDLRRSIREFENKKVPQAIIKKLIQNAVKAPSSQNKQPWRFYIVSSKNKRDKIAKILRKTLDKNQDEINKLPSPIKKAAYEFYDNLGNCQDLIFIYIPKDTQYKESDIVSVSAAMQNLVLSAVDYGLGTCCVGSFKGFEKEINRILNIPKNLELIIGLLVGYPKKGYKPLIRTKKKLNEIMKFV